MKIDQLRSRVLEAGRLAYGAGLLVTLYYAQTMVHVLR